MPAVDPQAAQLLGFVLRHDADGPGESPDMTFGIAGAILPLAVEMIRRLLENHRARRTRLFTMNIKILLQTDIDGLCVPAADGGGTGDMIGPFGINDDIAVAEAHFGMDKPPVGIAHQHARLETEGRLQKGHSRARIPVEDARAQNRVPGRIAGWHAGMSGLLGARGAAALTLALLTLHDAHALDAARVGIEHMELEAWNGLHDFAPGRDAA